MEEIRKYFANEDLRGANFEGADLRGAHFYDANLEGARCYGANLEGAHFINTNIRYAIFNRANLKGARFYGATLEKAVFIHANISHAIFNRANLKEADFKDANLEEASFIDTNACHAHFYRANLKKADLRGAHLRSASFDFADLENANFENVSIHTVYNASFSRAKNLPSINLELACPKSGSFIAYKVAILIDHSDYYRCIVVLGVPEDAKRTSATSNKCRCDKAKVLEIQPIDGTKADITKVCSFHDNKFFYTVGEEVSVPDFDENRWNECSTGIHFFMSRREALEYIGRL